MITRIDEYVTDTLRPYKDQSVPINPIFIAKEENLRVELLPNVDKRFGRIEYVKEARNFIAYCSKLIEYNDPVARFSLCHELGHFFIEEHRSLLIRGGKAHTSKSGFICDSLIEREADEFAAKLLIPPLFFRDYISEKKRLNIEGLQALANRCQASLTSACIRYINADIEPCAMIMINNGNFQRYSPSESAANGGFANIGHRNIPEHISQSFIKLFKLGLREISSRLKVQPKNGIHQKEEKLAFGKRHSSWGKQAGRL